MMQDFDTNGSFVLDFILHRCPLLRSTDMADCLLIDYYSSNSCKTKINSVKRFTMQQCQVDEQSLTKISLNMRLLKHVSLIRCIFTAAGSMYNAGQNNNFSCSTLDEYCENLALGLKDILR